MKKTYTLGKVRYLLTIVVLGVATYAWAQSERPNILWIVSEDNSPFLGCYGDGFATTPNIDQLAAAGLLFEQAFSNAPVCAPSRSTLITGVYPIAMGTEHMRSEYAVPEMIRLFPAYLRDAGYYTTNNAKTDYNLSPTKARMAAAWDESSEKASYKNRKPGQPFFAVYNSSISHESKIHKPLDTLMHDPARVPIPPYHPRTTEMEHDWAQYYDQITEMDAWVGQVLDELEKSGEADNTIVFYYSDHGGVLGRSKRFLFESGLHVPLIIRFPKKYAHLAPGGAGTRSDRMVSFVDFAPTVLGLVGIDVPEYMQGQPFLGATEPAEYAFGFRGRMDATIDLGRTVRDAKYRYTRNYMPHRIYGQHVGYLWRAPSMRSWEKAYKAGELDSVQSVFWRPKPYEELYDCEADPHNIHNLAADPAHRAVLERLRGALDRWMMNTNDVGFIPEAIMADKADTTTLYEFGRDGYAVGRVLETAAIAASGNPGGLDTLASRLVDEDPIVRYWAATGCRILEGRAAPAKAGLVRLLDDPVVAVRIAAAEACYALGERDRAVDVLTRALGDSNRLARLQALNALRPLGADARPALGPIRKIAASKEGKFNYDVRAAQSFIANFSDHRSNN